MAQSCGEMVGRIETSVSMRKHCGGINTFMAFRLRMTRRPPERLGITKNWGQRKSRVVGNLNDSLLDDERRNLFQHCKMSFGGPKSLGGIPKHSGEIWRNRNLKTVGDH